MSKKADKTRIRVLRAIDLTNKSVEEVQTIYTDEMLPDCPKDNPLVLDALEVIAGKEHRITRLDVCAGYDKDGLPLVFAIGDCPCGGSKCREGWGWEFKAIDLNMSGHRGSLWAVACEDNDKLEFDPTTGNITAPPPLGVNDEEWNSGRYEKSEWGNALTQEDKQTLARFQQQYSEKRKGGSDWVVDQ